MEAGTPSNAGSKKRLAEVKSYPPTMAAFLARRGLRYATVSIIERHPNDHVSGVGPFNANADHRPEGATVA